MANRKLRGRDQARQAGSASANDTMHDAADVASVVPEWVPSPGLPVTFEEVGCRLGGRTILEGISGCLPPATLTALMGPSGSGKTSLLDILTGRKTLGHLSGRVRYAGRQPTLPFLRRYAAYVEQFEALVDNLTVEEMLMCTAELKMPMSGSLMAKRARVEGVVAALGLHACRHTVIGTRLNRGLSGGELKRTNIALCLVGEPLVLFLDEATSGLDFYAAQEVMIRIRRLADRGLTVCCAIHAPPPSISALFQQVLVLSGGRLMYGGANGRSAAVFFEGLPLRGSKGMDRSGSDIEWVSSLAVEAARQGLCGQCAGVFASSALATEVKERITELSDPEAFVLSLAQEQALHTKTAVVNPSWWAVRTLLRYRARANYRSALFWRGRVADKIMFLFVLATLYYDVGKYAELETGCANTTSALFMWSIIPGFASQHFLPSLVLERTLYIRERSDGLYTAGAYLTAKMVGELAPMVVVSAFCPPLVWWSMSLSGSVLLIVIVYFTSIFAGLCLGYFVSAVAPTMELALVLLNTYIISLMFFSGLLIRVKDIPGYWSWLPRYSIFKYSFSALMVNQFEGLPEAVWPHVFYHPLEFLGLEGVNKWEYVVIQAAIALMFALGGWAALAWVPYGKK